MLWVILIFANGTALLLFNQTLAGTLVNLTLPAPPLSAPWSIITTPQFPPCGTATSSQSPS